MTQNANTERNLNLRRLRAGRVEAMAPAGRSTPLRRAARGLVFALACPSHPNGAYVRRTLCSTRPQAAQGGMQ
jgi:hypothetical protein